MTYDEAPKRVRRVVDRCRTGEVLCKTIRPKPTGETEAAWSFEPSGRAAPPKSSLDAIANGLLVPQGDGLFGDDHSQTWRA